MQNFRVNARIWSGSVALFVSSVIRSFCMPSVDMSSGGMPGVLRVFMRKNRLEMCVE